MVKPVPAEHAHAPGFPGSAGSRPDPKVQAQVEAFIVEQYAAGRSLSQLAELTGRSFSAHHQPATAVRPRRQLRHPGIPFAPDAQCVLDAMAVGPLARSAGGGLAVGAVPTVIIVPLLLAA